MTSSVPSGVGHHVAAALAGDDLLDRTGEVEVDDVESQIAEDDGRLGHESPDRSP